MFDREWEWDALGRFLADDSPNATLGMVSGRRRQGKSFLLMELCAATSGFYFAATEATEAESLRLLGGDLGAFLGWGTGPAFTAWDQAIDALLALGRDRRLPVVIDEFPYLCKASPALPSIIQRSLGPRRPERLASRARLILCGSALSFMGRLLSGSAPLRGRASMDLTVATFGFRDAARFWNIDDWWLALRVHAIVGGTPAYRRDYVRGDAPTRRRDFNVWVVRTVLSPDSPLFKEARFLLIEEPDLRDTALYHSVLAAVADGQRTRGGIAGYIGRKDDTLRHPITVLEDAGFLTREEDAFRQGRPTYRIAEPLVSFYHAIMRPAWADLEQRRAKEVWSASGERFASNVLGPHFEALCRTWARECATPDTFGGRPARVAATVVNDPARKRTHQVDVAVVADDGRVLSLGEAKVGTTMGVADLQRLDHIRGLLAARGDLDVHSTKLACYSATGFTADLRAAAAAGHVVLVDLERLYTGS
jgi:uncharacterized protein